MIGRVHRRGSRVGGLLRYLFGPGRAEEHVNPRLVGAWDGAGPLADLEPTVTATGARDFRHLVGLLEQPVRAITRPPEKFVWHTSLRLAPADRHRTISDQTWGQIAREMLAEAGFARHGDDTGLRFVVVRHNDDHIHIVATTVRENGRIDWFKNDRPRVVDATASVARRFGLTEIHRNGRTSPRPPGQPETHKAERLGQPRTDREELRQRVRIAVAAAGDEGEFFAALGRAGVLVKLRDSTHTPGQITGYAVALPPEPGRTPVWFSGGKLAADLTLPKLRHRWGTPAAEPIQPRSRTSRIPRAERVRVLRDAATTAQTAATFLRDAGHRDPGAAQAVAEAAADALHAVAASLEGRRGGPVTAAAHAFDRAARAGLGPTGRHTANSRRMRAMARLVSLIGRVTGDDDAVAALKLVLTLAALGDTLSQLRRAQQRLHQAEAARDAAHALRAAATSHPHPTGSPAASSPPPFTPRRVRTDLRPPARPGGPS